MACFGGLNIVLRIVKDTTPQTTAAFLLDNRSGNGNGRRESLSHGTKGMMSRSC